MFDHDAEHSHSLLHQVVSAVLDSYLAHADFIYDMHPVQLPQRHLRLAFELDLNADDVIDCVAALPEELIPTAARLDDIIPVDPDLDDLPF